MPRGIRLGLGFLAVVLASAQVGPFRLRVLGSQPARFYLTDSKGKIWTPEGAISYSRGAEQHFIVRNGFEISLPAGSYSLTVERGPEYVPIRETIEAREGRERSLRTDPKRWIDMNRLGWYSGDLHNHRRVEHMPLLLLAEDLNLAPTLTDWIWDDRANSTPPAVGPWIQQVDSKHVYSVFDKEVERLKNGPGAVDLVGLQKPIPFAGYQLFPPNDTFAREAHAQGAWVDAEKIVWRDTVALVALGLIDSAGIVYNHFNRHGVELETESWGMVPKDRSEFRTPAGMPLWAMEIYYRFLNCGFRLPVSAGSASGVKALPLGYNRVYVQTGEQFTYENWFRLLKGGHTFATNGPMLFLTVDGKGPGASLRFNGAKSHRTRIVAEAVSATPLDRLEVLFKGKVIRTVRGSSKLRLEHDMDTRETGWIAARAFEKPEHAIRFAHTSPVYIQFPADKGIVADDVRYLIEWIDREMSFYGSVAGFREPAHRKAMIELFIAARETYSKLLQSLDDGCQ